MRFWCVISVHFGETGHTEIIQDMITNSLASISEGGSTEVSVTQNQHYCAIKIEDDGLGISEENRAKLFSHGFTTGNSGEAGVSLYNAKIKIQSWGGKLFYVPSEKGAVFLIKLPLAERGIFVGLVGDERFRIIDDQSMTENSLIQSGFKVLASAETYKEGLELLKNSPEDGATFLVDHRLDCQNLGTDLIAAQSKRDKIYLCTNDYDCFDVILRARELGIKILPKPLCLYTLFS